MSRFALALLLGLALAVGSSSAAAPESGAAPVVKKPCKLVTKVVKGKKVRVRVCAKAARCKFVTKKIKGKKKRVRVCAKAAKPRCNFVTKRINGKKKRVKVCPKKKQAPSRQPPAPQSPPAPQPPLAQQDAIARSVADRLAAATTVEAREQALLEAARALHVGVYRGDGTPIAAGAERSADDFFLYDFELRILAESLARGDSLDLSGLASALEALGVRRNGNPISADELGQLIVAGARTAVGRPADPRSIGPLLIRELGLHRVPGYDLAGEIPADARFDALQILLLAADAALSPPSTRLLSAFPAATLGVDQQSRCIAPFGGSTIERYIGNQIMQGAVLGGPGSILLLHLAVLGMDLHILDLSPGEHRSHYGKAGHATDAGKQLDFLVGVGFIKTEQSPRCGPLSVLATAGVVPNPTVDWSSKLFKDGSAASSHNLERHGLVTTGATDAGKAGLNFVPKNELVPGFGEEKGATGEVRAELRAATVGEYVLRAVFPKQVTWPVKVRYHKPRGFKFSPIPFSFQIVNDNCTFHLNGPCKFTDTMSGRICGDDPYAAPWEIHSVRTANYNDPTGTIDYTMGLDQPISVGDHYRALEWVGPTAQADYRVKLTYVAGLGWQPTSPTSATVPLAEDTSCPEND